MARMCASLNEVVSDDPRWPDVPNATRSDGIAGSGRRSKYAPTRRSTSIRSPGSAGRPASSLTAIVGPSIGRRARARAGATRRGECTEMEGRKRLGSARAGSHELRVHEAEQVDGVGQVAVEDPVCHVEQLEEVRVVHAIDDRRAAPLGGHDVAAAQDRKLLRDRRRRRSDRVLELTHAQRPAAEQLEDPDPHRMGERLEELRLELAEALRVVASLVAEHAGQGTRPGYASQLPNSATVSYTHLTLPTKRIV